MLPVAVVISFQKLKSKVVIEAIFPVEVDISLALPCSCWIQALLHVYTLKRPLRALFAVCGKLRCLRKVLKSPLGVRSNFDWLQWCCGRVTKTEIVMFVLKISWAALDCPYWLSGRCIELCQQWLRWSSKGLDVLRRGGWHISQCPVNLDKCNRSLLQTRHLQFKSFFGVMLYHPGSRW